MFGQSPLTQETLARLFTRFNSQLTIKSLRAFGNGLYNDVWLVNTVEQEPRYRTDAFVLRIAPSDTAPQLFYEKGMMHSEPLLHTLIKEKTTLPVPAIYFHDFSRDLIDRDYLVMEYLPGCSGSFTHHQLGQMVRQLHNLKGTSFGYPARDLPVFAGWPETFLAYAELIFKDCLRVNIITQAEYDAFLKIYRRQASALHACTPSLLHLELWSVNILTSNNEITGLLDFDRGMWGDPELEFAVLDTYGYSTPDFFAGYGLPRPDDDAAGVRQKLYYVYEMIKYAFIRLVRGRAPAVAVQYVRECQSVLRGL
jgi:fructosamine-3-kinase